jgi:hypothetical protein
MRRLTLLLILIGFATVSALAYTVVLKDGTRIEAKAKPKIQAGTMVFTGTEGKDYRLPVLEVDSPATRAANGEAKPKRIWTNDEIGSSSSPSAAETGEDQDREGESKQAEGPQGTGKAAEGGERDLAGHDRSYYQRRIQALRAQIRQIDDQIKKYNESKGLNTWTTPEGGAWWNLQRTDPTIKLQEQKTTLQKQIDEIEEEARRNGAPPGWTRE